MDSSDLLHLLVMRPQYLTMWLIASLINSITILNFLYENTTIHLKLSTQLCSFIDITVIDDHPLPLIWWQVTLEFKENNESYHTLYLLIYTTWYSRYRLVTMKYKRENFWFTTNFLQNFKIITGVFFKICLQHTIHFTSPRKITLL